MYKKGKIWIEILAKEVLTFYGYWQKHKSKRAQAHVITTTLNVIG